MRTCIKYIILLIVSSLSMFNCKAQVLDMDCISNTFYAPVGHDVHRLQFTGTSVTDLGVVAPSTYNFLLGLAYGYDILNNSTNRTLYTTVNTSPNPSAVIRYNGAGWDTVATDSLAFHQAGGYGRFIYFQRAGGAADECIKRLNPDGSLTEIFNDSTAFVFTVADIAVDSTGNVYLFRGSGIGSTTELTVIDSSGNIINSYATTLNNLAGIYGSMFFHDTLYLGCNGQLFPVIINGSAASLGTPVSTPAGLSLSDLANCHDIVPTGINETDESLFIVYYNALENSLEIFNPFQNRETIRIFSSDGRLMYHDYCNTGSNSYNLTGWSPGVYVIMAGDKNIVFKKKFCLIK